MRGAHAIRIFPEILEEACWLCGEEAMRRNYPHLFVHPKEARVNREFAIKELGGDCRLEPEELLELFRGAVSGYYSGPDSMVQALGASRIETCDKST
jgi:hypothetical protein